MSQRKKDSAMAKDNSQPTTQRIYQQIREVLIQACSRALQAVNTEMVTCYWQIGRLIIEEEQRGAKRASYGQGLIKELAKRLTDEFGRGFHQRNLWFMRNFYLAYPKVNALRSELSWLYYRMLFT
jgi:predicted GNAT family N-acyltransferase